MFLLLHTLGYKLKKPTVVNVLRKPKGSISMLKPIKRKNDVDLTDLIMKQFIETYSKRRNEVRRKQAQTSLLRFWSLTWFSLYVCVLFMCLCAIACCYIRVWMWLCFCVMSNNSSTLLKWYLFDPNGLTAVKTLLVTRLTDTELTHMASLLLTGLEDV